MQAQPLQELPKTALVTPDTAGFAGNMYHGHLLKLLDQVARAWVSSLEVRYVVTV